MQQGWKCPNCGKAHGPHVDTCPEAGGLAPPLFPVPLSWPGTLYDPPRDRDDPYHSYFWPNYVTC